MSPQKANALWVLLIVLVIFIALLLVYRKKISSLDDISKVFASIVSIVVFGGTTAFILGSPPKAPQFVAAHDYVPTDLIIMSSEGVEIYYSTSDDIDNFIEYTGKIHVDDSTRVSAYTKDYFAKSEVVTTLLTTPMPTPTPTTTPTPTPMDRISQGITFVDPAFEEMLRAALNRPVEPIFPSELADCTGIALEGNYLALGETFYRMTFTPEPPNHIGKIETLVDLLHFPALEDLDIKGQLIKNLETLSSLTKLRMLDLQYCNITDLSPLIALTDLGSLNLIYNNIDDLTSLSELKGLYNLTLWIDYIPDLPPLSDIVELDRLELRFDLSYNFINDLSPLSQFTELKTLYLDYNSITDLSPLSSLVNLEQLTLGHNEISDLTPLSGLKKLNFLNLEENPITDWSPVKYVQDVWGRP